MEKEKSAGELLQEKLLLNRKNIGMTADDASEQAAQDFCEPYKAFLDACKMEREAVSWIVKKAREAGYAFMQVKTVQMGKYAEYDATNRFYLAMGFKEFEVFPHLWDEWNPCQVYVMGL